MRGVYPIVMDENDDRHTNVFFVDYDGGNTIMVLEFHDDKKGHCIFYLQEDQIP